MPLTLTSKPFSLADNDVVALAEQFAANNIVPHAETWEREKIQPPLIREAIKTFTKYYISKELGGEGASASTLALELEALAKADYGFTFGFEVHNHVTIMVAGIEDASLRDRYLGKLMRGEMIGAFLLTEPNAGSDAASIQCRAVQTADGWVLDGKKTWVTNAGTADLLLVWAQAGEGSDGIMGFLVERGNPGVEFIECYDMTGAHAMATGAIELRNCKVDAGAVAYPQGKGFKAALSAIDFARFAVAAMCNGAYINCLETAVDYAREREQFGKPIIKNQGLSFRLADQLTQLEASRLLTYSTAAALDSGIPASVAAAHCKKFASRAAYEGASIAMQSMGSNGLLRRYPLVRQLSALTIAFHTDGTNDICNIVIGRSLQR